MRLTISIFKAAVAASCLSVAACGGDSTADSQSSHDNTPAATVLKAAWRKTASPNGTTIPSATNIIDSSGNDWSVGDGVIYENGALAGYSRAVTLLIYVNNEIYQQNAAGGWWSWNGDTWVASSDPRTAVSANGTTIPSVAQIIDSSGDVWVVSRGVIYLNGALAGYSKGVTQLVYENNVIYQENSAGGWWSWNGSTWVSSNDPVGGTTVLTMSGSPAASDAVGQAYSFVPTTSNTGGAALTFSIANMPVWASFNTANGALTGTPSSSQAGTYSNILISASNGSDSASLPEFSIVVDIDSVTLTWTAPTQNTNGTPLTDLSGYTIYYGTDSSDLNQTIQVPMPNATSYEISNLPAGTYFFAVAAYTAEGMRSEQSSVGWKTIL